MTRASGDELSDWRKERLAALNHDLPLRAETLAAVAVTDPLSEDHESAARVVWEFSDERDRLSGGPGLDRADWPRPGSFRRARRAGLSASDARDSRPLGGAVPTDLKGHS